MFTIATVLGSVGDVFTAMIDWFTDVVTVISANPLLLIFVILAIVGIVFGMVRSLIPGRGI